MKMLMQMLQGSSIVSVTNSAIQRKTFPFLKKCHFSSHKVPNNKITRNTVVTPFPPLTKPVPNLPKAIYATTKEEHHVTKVTVLSNGLRVASENRFGPFCTVGVIIDSGPRYEVAYPSGISHFLEKLAFGATKTYENKDQVLLTLDKLGGICDCQVGRDTCTYAASTEHRGLDKVVQILGDIVLRPQITQEEVNAARQMIRFELESLLTRPEQELILTDMIHAAAYRNNTLGLPRICPKENIDVIDRKILLEYLKHHYTPSRMVVAGCGVEHEDLVSAVQKYFVDEKPIWEEEQGTSKSTLNTVDASIAQYTGGYMLEECNIPVYVGPSGLPELSHVVIGLEACSHEDPDFVPLCVLNMMMGGGNSFSAGGPGKGMFTRLFLNVLNRYHWIHSAVACNHVYIDTGLFCIHASCTPSYVKDMVEVIIHEMVSMANCIMDSELARAKKQLQSMVFMNLETRPVMFEDIGKQVLAIGYRKRPEYYIEAIDAVSREDIKNVVRRLLKSPPSVAARGEIKTLPSIGDIQAALIDEQGRLPGSRSRLSLLR